MRRLAPAVVFLLLCAGPAFAGPRNHCNPGGRTFGERFPRIGALGRAVRATPSTFPRHPAGSVALQAGITTIDLIGSAALQGVAAGGPQVIRLVRVLFYGSPIPGRPGLTALWVASPTIITARNYILEVRALRMAGVIGVCARCWGH